MRTCWLESQRGCMRTCLLESQPIAATYWLALKRHGELHMVIGGRVAEEIVKGGGVGRRNEGRVGGRERGRE